MAAMFSAAAVHESMAGFIAASLASLLLVMAISGLASLTAP